MRLCLLGGRLIDSFAAVPVHLQRAGREQAGEPTEPRNLCPPPVCLSARLHGQGRGLAELRDAVRAELALPHPDRPGSLPAGTPARLAAVASAVVVFAGLTAIAGATDVFESVERGGWRWLGGALAFAVWLALDAPDTTALTPTARGVGTGG